MFLRAILLAALIAVCILHGSCEDQTILTRVQKLVLDFDDLYTKPKTGIGTSSSFRYKGLNVNSFTPVNIVDAVGPPEHRVDVQDADCMASYPNVLVGRRNDPRRDKTYWPSLSTCNYLDKEAPELLCNGTFNVISFSVKPMGHIPMDEDGNGVVGVTLQLDFIRLLETKKTEPDETVDGLPPVQPWFPVDLRNRTVYSLQLGFFTQGHAPPWEFHVSLLGVPGYATGIDTIEMSAESVYPDDTERRSVDWPFCIDNLVLEFNHDSGADEANVLPNRPDGIWRERRIFGEARA